jgi:hypothetical protein
MPSGFLSARHLALQMGYAREHGYLEAAATPET